MKKDLSDPEEGFAFTKLLTVVAIITIVAIVVFWAVNPKKILQKSHDSQRFSDVTEIATGINLYLADGKTFGASGTYGSEGMTNVNNDGVGWLPVNFASVASGPSIATLPLDPVNDSGYHYTVGINKDNNTYEIDCVYENPDNASKMTSDGGNNANAYEVGTDLTILP